MIAVPFYFVRACRGVVSCVQTETARANEQTAGLSTEHLGQS